MARGRIFASLALAACSLSCGHAQSTSSGGAAAAAAANASIPVAPLASIIASTGIVPSNLVDAAAAYLSVLATSTRAQLLAAFAQPGIDPAKILDPEGYYSYGHSPPVYPSPQGTGEGEWASAYARARALVAQMTDAEKNAVVTPALDSQGCSGFTGSVPRLGFPGICLNDASSGPRLSDTANVSGYPGGISVAASWNADLARQRAEYIGAEFKAKGINVALGPVVGPLGRVAMGGRNWEGFSTDPYLAGSLAAPTVQGLQQNVIACVKHFIANEQETNRNPFLDGLLAPLGINLNNSVSSNLDDRTMHELYLWPFYDAVNAGVGAVMASYNRVNNSYATQNSKTLNGLLKTELGFQGFVVSDWFAQHTGIASANAGLDLVMPTGTYWGNEQLVAAVRNGSVDSSRLDDMATRILAAWYRFAEFQTPGVNAHDAIDARDPASAETILQSAIEGHVLVKNVGNALPLQKPQILSVFGYDSVSGYNTSASDPALYPLALANTREYTDGTPFGDLQALIIGAAVAPAGTTYPEVAFNGTIISGGGSGAITPASMVSPYDALLREAALDGTTLYTDFVSQDPEVRGDSDACLVLVNTQSSESADRMSLADEWSDTLISNVAQKCSNTIVVIHNAGIRLVDSWIDNPNVTAVLFGHIPGQASGSALVELLYGRQSPSGRLPYTVARNASDYGSLLHPTFPTPEDPQYSQSNFSEGLNIDYRHFLAHQISPRFAFGFGLTYSSFEYDASSLGISLPSKPVSCTYARRTELEEQLASVSVSIRNAGPVPAAEVAQLYLSIPNSGQERVLRGFQKLALQPAETKEFVFQLRRRDLSVWDVEKQMWTLQKGEYVVRIGKSAEEVLAVGEFVLELED